MANGEKRLFSLINATVSHEMRNPTNSIQAQVQEQKVLNQKLKDSIEAIKADSINQDKKNLKRLWQRQIQSTAIQNSAVKILNILVNDMLDYAQLSSGKFRKNYTRINLVDSISEIIEVLNYKASELGITLKKSFKFPSGKPN